MTNTFKFTFPTFDTEEFNEIILDVPFTNSDDLQSSKGIDEKIMTASVNEIINIIVSEMILSVKQDLSKLNRTKA